MMQQPPIQQYNLGFITKLTKKKFILISFQQKEKKKRETLIEI
jgi:hypothetical protein